MQSILYFQDLEPCTGIITSLEIQEIEFFKPPKSKMHFAIFILLFLPTEYISSLFYHGDLPSLKCLLKSLLW